MIRQYCVRKQQSSIIYDAVYQVFTTGINKGDATRLKYVIRGLSRPILDGPKGGDDDGLMGDRCPWGIAS